MNSHFQHYFPLEIKILLYQFYYLKKVYDLFVDCVVDFGSSTTKGLFCKVTFSRIKIQYESLFIEII